MATRSTWSRFEITVCRFDERAGRYYTHGTRPDPGDGYMPKADEIVHLRGEYVECGSDSWYVRKPKYDQQENRAGD